MKLNEKLRTIYKLEQARVILKEEHGDATCRTYTAIQMMSENIRELMSDIEPTMTRVNKSKNGVYGYLYKRLLCDYYCIPENGIIDAIDREVIIDKENSKIIFKPKEKKEKIEMFTQKDGEYRTKDYYKDDLGLEERYRSLAYNMSF